LSGLLLVLFLPLSLAMGVAAGILIQRRRLPARLRRRALSALASSRGQSARSGSKRVSLEVRGSGHGDDATSPSTERDGHHIYRTLELPISELALVLIDVWADHPVKGWAERADENMRTRLLPLVQAAREHGVLVIHCPHGRATSPLLPPLPDEPVLDDPAGGTRMVKTLQQRGVNYLLYAGYSSNMCVLTRPTGIIEMARQGYEIVFVRDASLAIEAPEFLDGQLTHGVATYMVETNWGVTTEVDQVLAALETA
jgi:nicotinamidase-related amidase